MSTTQAISKSCDIEIDTYCPASAEDWRQWLLRNHDAKQSVWLVYDIKNAKKPKVTCIDAVDEALCFGWIDSRAKPLDDEKFMLFCGN